MLRTIFLEDEANFWILSDQPSSLPRNMFFSSRGLIACFDTKFHHSVRFPRIDHKGDCFP